jgi:hypothetical protein
VIYRCCDDARRNAVRQSAFNGIDFLEVVDNPAGPIELRQRTLHVHFIHPLAPGELNVANVQIEGGERVRGLKVIDIQVDGISSPPASPPQALGPNVLVVRVDRAGDFSTYRLRLVQEGKDEDPPDGFDPILCAVDFSFKVACPSDFDCETVRPCPPEPRIEPEIDYLAKDYASFRRLIFDRMAAVIPQWRERNPADLGVALVELLAYVGDYLSYQQDAVATESYLGTARKRASVRRHARLVDYAMHDGSNSRVWVQVLAAPGIHGFELKPRLTQVLTRVADGMPCLIPNSAAHARALAARPEAFELMHGLKLYHEHNEIKFYTWDARECCLPKGATQATVRGHFPHLEVGQVLILAEVRGPSTGEPEDADPQHRHAVRLTKIKLDLDPLHPATSPPGSPLSALPVTEIEWHPEDALPFPLCISSRSGTDFFEDVSVAWGNIVLADHGVTVDDEPEDKTRNPYTVASSLSPDFVPRPHAALSRVVQVDADACARSERGSHCVERHTVDAPPRYRPRLLRAPLTQAAPYDASASASAVMRERLLDARPAIQLKSFGLSPAKSFDALDAVKTWTAQRDLIASRAEDNHFVVETENDGAAYLRFGDSRFGARPDPEERFLGRYRIGNGTRGNVAAEALAHLVSDEVSDQVIAGVRNPLPAQGGVDAETIEHARQNAPSAFRTQERAVTSGDYADLALRCEMGVQRAAATLRWTGSWRTVFLTADRLGGQEVDADFERDLRRCLERFRLAGHDLEVDSARFVALEVALTICVKPDYFASDVKAALLEILSNRTLPDGRRGVFHPDNFSFGQPVLLSPLYAAAQAVAGVDSVTITRFERSGIPSDSALKSGELAMGRLEIARLDNDPNFPERGVLALEMRGGR